MPSAELRPDFDQLVIRAAGQVDVRVAGVAALGHEQDLGALAGGHGTAGGTSGGPALRRKAPVGVYEYGVNREEKAVGGRGREGNGVGPPKTARGGPGR